MAQHAVDELARPAAIACIEPDGAAIERGIEEVTAAHVGADHRCRDACFGHSTDRRAAAGCAARGIPARVPTSGLTTMKGALRHI
jgi:hypothetical protein